MSLKYMSWAISLAATLVIQGVSAAWAGGEKGSGGGTAESAMLVAPKNLASYLRVCAASSSCGLDERQKALLLKIDEELASLDPTSMIEFKSEAEDPGFFMIGGVIRAAKTMLQRGAKIYVNRDLLYPSDISGHPQPLSYAASVGLLTHEFGHHQGIADETSLDLLGSKLQSFMNGSVQQSWLGLMIINFDAYVPKQGVFPHAQIFQKDSSGMVDITDGFWEAASAMSSAPCGVKAVGYRIDNLHSLKLMEAGEDYQVYFNQANLWFACEMGTEDRSHVIMALNNQVQIRVRLDGNFSQTPLMTKVTGKWFEFYNCSDKTETRCH